SEWLSFLPQGVPLWVYGAGAGALLLLVLIAAFLLLRRRRRRKVIAAASAAALSAPAAAHQISRSASGAAMSEGLEESGGNLETFIQQQQERLKLKENAALASLKGVKPRNDSDVLIGHLIDTVSKDPAGAAQILRSWLTEDRR